MIGLAAAQLDNGSAEIDMDEVADAFGHSGKKPRYYYAERSQQHQYVCAACDGFNDILGRFAYCSSCGTHNCLQELEHDVQELRSKVAQGQYAHCIRNAVAAFDSLGRQLAKQLAARGSMTETRRKDWRRKLFHALRSCANSLREEFEISLFAGMTSEEEAFAIRMFHRRHVHEHNGGEADAKYIADSGDQSVRPKQLLRETEESATGTLDVVLKLAKNFHEGFHAMFPPEQEPLRFAATRNAVQRSPKGRK